MFLKISNKSATFIEEEEGEREQKSFSFKNFFQPEKKTKILFFLFYFKIMPTLH
jgi:hypothetical protein